MRPVTSIIAVVGSALLLAACNEQTNSQQPRSQAAAPATQSDLALQVRSASGIRAQRLIAGEQAGSLVINAQGIQLLDSNDSPVATALPGYYDTLAVQPGTAGLLAASHDLQRDQPVILRWNAAGAASAPECPYPLPLDLSTPGRGTGS